jgi:hypothetical protein
LLEVTDPPPIVPGPGALLEAHPASAREAVAATSASVLAHAKVIRMRSVQAFPPGTSRVAGPGNPDRLAPQCCEPAFTTGPASMLRERAQRRAQPQPGSVIPYRSVVGDQRVLAGRGEPPVVPDTGGHGEQALGDAGEHSRGGASAVSFEVQAQPAVALYPHRVTGSTILMILGNLLQSAGEPHGDLA